MAVRLLLDENLSERLLPVIAERFPGSLHCRALGLGGAADGALWDAALREGCLRVTKDEDFVAWSPLRGAPPKVVWLRTGNSNTSDTAAVLLQQADAIEMFAGHPDAGRRSITADTDLRLCRFLGRSNGYWLRAQAAYDTEVAQASLAAAFDRIKPWSETAA